WTDLDGDGKVVIGAEQWPECLNPVTECANSSWMVWTTINQVMPGAFATTNDGAYVITNLLKGEPKVAIKEGRAPFIERFARRRAGLAARLGLRAVSFSSRCRGTRIDRLFCATPE
ncbi:MAG: hypothetical protein ACKOJH_14460, partial [Actinomycetota bacterium]